MRRRELFERTAGITGLAALLAACGADPADMSAPGQTKPSNTVRQPVAEWPDVPASGLYCIVR